MTDLHPITGKPLALTSEELGVDDDVIRWCERDAEDWGAPILRDDFGESFAQVYFHAVPDDVSGDAIDNDFNEVMIARLFRQRDAAEQDATSWKAQAEWWAKGCDNLQAALDAAREEAARLLEDNKKLTEERDLWKEQVQVGIQRLLDKATQRLDRLKWQADQRAELERVIGCCDNICEAAARMAVVD